MQYTTSTWLLPIVRVLPWRLHGVAVLCFVGLALLGVGLDVSGGWLACPPVAYALPALRRQRSVPHDVGGTDAQAAWWYVQHTWPQPFLQRLVLHLLWLTHGHSAPAWGMLVPWLAWICPLVGLLWPPLARQPE